MSVRFNFAQHRTFIAGRLSEAVSEGPCRHNRRLAVPLKTLNPPSMRRFARVAALAHLRHLQEVNAALIKLKGAALETKSAGAAPSRAVKLEKKTHR